MSSSRAKEAKREKIAAQKRAYAERNGEKILGQQRARRARARLLLRPDDLIEAAKRRVAADPMRHWKSPPCS